MIRDEAEAPRLRRRRSNDLPERCAPAAAAGEIVDTWGFLAAIGAALLTFIVLRRLLCRRIAA